MVYGLIQSFFYEIGSIEEKFWSFIYITSLIMIGSLGMIILYPMLINEAKGNLKQRILNYLSVVILYITSFLLFGTIISYEAISRFLGSEFFPEEVYYFLFLIEIFVLFGSMGFFGIIRKKDPTSNNRKN